MVANQHGICLVCGNNDPKKPCPCECSLCVRIRDEHKGFGPNHRASSMCESGKREHCSCDLCFTLLLCFVAVSILLGVSRAYLSAV